MRELVSGPNLDADRMDYLQRDAYFTGVATGSYDADQLLGSLRIVSRGGRQVVGIDRRGVVALESFVMARYMMFATVYFHHTTRMFEHVLHEVLRELWPNPRALDEIGEYLRWDDFRVLNSLDDSRSEAAYALRNRVRVYALAAEFNAERDLRAFGACEAALCERFGEANVWADSQSQLRHRLPLGIGQPSTVLVDGPSGPNRCARGLRRHRQTQRDRLLAQTFVRRFPAARMTYVRHAASARRSSRLAEDADCRLSGGQPRDWDPIGRARDVIQAQAIAEGNAAGFAAVFAADADLEMCARRTP